MNNTVTDNEVTDNFVGDNFVIVPILAGETICLEPVTASTTFEQSAHESEIYL